LIAHVITYVITLLNVDIIIVQLNNNTMNAEQALSVLVQIANAHLCTKQDRVIIDQAVAVLSDLVKAQAGK